MWVFMIGVPCKNENLGYVEHRVLFYQPVQELQHFFEKSKIADILFL